MITSLPAGCILVHGQSIELLVLALEDAQRWRRRNGLAPLSAYSELAEILRRAKQPGSVTSANGHADIETEPAGQPDSMTTHEVASELNVTRRHVRRQATQLGGRKVAGSWIFNRADIIANTPAGTS